jgi:hypothetical protein
MTRSIACIGPLGRIGLIAIVRVVFSAGIRDSLPQIGQP